MPAHVSDSPLGHPQIFKVGARRFAFGLFWQAGESPKTVVREAKALAADKRVHADLYVIRPGAECQFGLGRKSDGLVPGTIAAAAAAAQRLKGSWLGAFRLGQGFWIVAIRDDLVLPDGDRYYATESEARERFLAEHHEGGWQRVFAPRGWLDGAEEVSATKLLETAKQPKLAEVNPLASQIKYFVAGGTILALVFGMAWYYHHVQTAAPVPLPRPPSLPKPPPPVVAPAPPPPWYARPATAALLEDCFAQLSAVPTHLPGYTLKTLRCDTTRFSAHFARSGGIAAWVESWARENAPGYVLNIAASGDAELAGAMTPLKPRGTEGLHQAAPTSRALAELAQTLGDDLTLGKPRLPEREKEDSAPQVMPEFAPMALSITTPNPGAWATYIGSVPGLVVSAIEFDASAMKWKIQGDLYVRL